MPEFPSRVTKSEIYETGIVPVDGWTPVSFQNTYTNPVIVVTGQQGGDIDMATEKSRPIIRNLTSNSVELIVMNDFKATLPENVGYLVMEKGHHILDGLEVVATTYQVTDTSTQTINYGATISSAIPIDSIQEETPGPVSSRYSGLASDSYSVYWEDFFGTSSETSWSCGTVVAGVIAVESGQCQRFEAGIETSVTADPEAGKWRKSKQKAWYVNPVLFVNPFNDSGPDKTIVGRSDKNYHSVNVRPTETTTVDSEQGHATCDIPVVFFKDTTKAWRGVP